MKVYIVDNFKVGIKRLIDERTNVKTLEELNNLEKDFLPYGLMIYCEETDMLYQYSKEDKFIPLSLSIEQMFFEYNEDTEKYDIPIYVHNPKIYEHTKEEVEDWIGLLKTENVSAKSIFIDNDIIVDTKTWNTIKLNEYDEEKLEKHRNYINNSLTSIIKPTYKKVDGIEEMIETGNFYIMENKETGNYLIHVVADNGEVLSISSTNVDMSDYQPKLAEDLKTKNKYIVESLNEMNDGIKKQTSIIGIDNNNKGIGLGGEPSTISEFIGDTYVSYLKSVGSLDSLTTDDKTSFTSALNEINDKVGKIGDITALAQKDSIVNSINALYQSAKIFPGTIMMYGGTTAPEGFLLCDGSSLNPSDYSDLYDVIGSTYGLNADGTFNLPNLKGRAIIGRNPGDARWDNLGDTYGSKKVVLYTPNIPSHMHTFSGSHKHGEGVTQYTNDNSFSLPRSMSNNGRSGSTHDSAVYNSQGGNHYHGDKDTGSESHTHSGETNDGGEGHNNLMPYIVLSYIIKY